MDVQYGWATNNLTIHLTVESLVRGMSIARWYGAMRKIVALIWWPLSLLVGVLRMSECGRCDHFLGLPRFGKETCGREAYAENEHPPFRGRHRGAGAMQQGEQGAVPQYDKPNSHQESSKRVKEHDCTHSASHRSCGDLASDTRQEYVSALSPVPTRVPPKLERVLPDFADEMGA